MESIPRRLWQLAGALALGHVVFMIVGLAMQSHSLFHEGADGIRENYVDGDLARSFGGGMIETFAFVMFIPIVVFVSRAYGRTTEAGRWAATTGALCGVGYVAVTIAVGFPAGAAAMYGVQHGLDVDTAFALNNVRVFAYFLSLALLGAQTIAVALSAHADRTGGRWVTWFGLATGLGLMAAPPLAALELQDVPTLVWMVWFVGLAVQLIRHRDGAVAVPRSAARETAIGHS